MTFKVWIYVNANLTYQINLIRKFKRDLFYENKTLKSKARILFQLNIKQLLKSN